MYKRREKDKIKRRIENRSRRYDRKVNKRQPKEDDFKLEVLPSPKKDKTSDERVVLGLFTDLASSVEFSTK